MAVRDVKSMCRHMLLMPIVTCVCAVFAVASLSGLYETQCTVELCVNCKAKLIVHAFTQRHKVKRSKGGLNFAAKL